MKKLVYYLAALYFSTTAVFGEDREGLIKTVKKNQYVKTAEWINDKEFLFIVHRKVSSEAFEEALRDVCKLGKMKFSIKEFQAQISYKKNKILKKKNCK